MIYAFEDYELDLQRYALRYAGKLVKLEPQVFNILVYLIQHRDRVMTKEEILEHLSAVVSGRITLPVEWIVDDHAPGSLCPQAVQW